MKAARTQNQPKHPLLIPGIGVKTSPTDGFPIEQVALQRWVSGKGSAPATGRCSARCEPQRASAA